jgi:plasmid stability protein
MTRLTIRNVGPEIARRLKLPAAQHEATEAERQSTHECLHVAGADGI